MDSERQVQQRALILAEMEAFHRKRQDEDETLCGEIEELNTTITESVSTLHLRGDVTLLMTTWHCMN